MSSQSAPDFTEAEIERYSRHILLREVGGAGQARLRSASVLVVGDAMLDRYVYGEVERVSPEAPVPILTVTR